MTPDVDKFILDQLSVAPGTAQNYRDLRSVKVRRIVLDGLPVTIQCNPSRLFSATAGTPLAVESGCVKRSVFSV